MINQKAIAFGLLTASAAAAAYMSRQPLVPAAIWLAAALALATRLSLPISRPVRLVAILVATVLFVAVSRIAPEGPQGAYPLSILSLTHVVGWYFLVLMAGTFFVGHGQAMPRPYPLYATGALICAGNVFTGARQDRIYMLLAMAVAVLTGLYFSAERRYLDEPARRKLPGRKIVTALVCLAAVIGAGVTSALLSASQYQLDRAITSLAGRIYPGRRVGFSDEMALRSVMFLKTRVADEPALRVVSRRMPGYLQGRAFVELLGPRWAAPSDRDTIGPTEESFPGLGPSAAGRKRFALSRGASGPWEAFEIFPEGIWTRSMFCPKGTGVISASLEELQFDACGTLLSPGRPVRDGYTAFVPAVLKPPRPTAQTLQMCATVPAQVHPRVRALAHRLLRNCRTRREKIRAVENYFTTHYTYRLGIQIPQGVDPLSYFLLERPPAHCEFFAAGAVALLRLGGVPAYYATGFVVNERCPYGDYWIARHGDAHAWAEACDEDGRWVTVEATPPAGVPGAATRSRSYYLWDSFKFRAERLFAYLRREGLAGAGAWCLTQLGGAVRFLCTTAGGLALFACLGALSAWVLWRRLRRARRPKPDPRIARLRRLLRKTDRRVKKLAQRAPSETLTEFARHLRQEGRGSALASSAAQWYESYVAVRYGRRVDETALARLKRRMPGAIQGRRTR